MDTGVEAETEVAVAGTVLLLPAKSPYRDMPDSDPDPDPESERSDLTIGDWVYDHEDDEDDDDEADPDPDIAIVVNTPGVPANEWEVPVPDTETLAEDNPDYPADAPTVVVVYRDELREARSEWRERTEPYPLSDLAEDGVSFYAFPAGRLTPASDAPDDATDIDNTTDV